MRALHLKAEVAARERAHALERVPAALRVG